MNDEIRCGNCPCMLRTTKDPHEGECRKDSPRATLEWVKRPITGAMSVRTLSGYPLITESDPGCWQHPVRAALYMQMVAQAMSENARASTADRESAIAQATA